MCTTHDHESDIDDDDGDDADNDETKCIRKTCAKMGRTTDYTRIFSMQQLNSPYFILYMVCFVDLCISDVQDVQEDAVIFVC